MRNSGKQFERTASEPGVGLYELTALRTRLEMEKSRGAVRFRVFTECPGAVCSFAGLFIWMRMVSSWSRPYGRRRHFWRLCLRGRC